MCLDVLQDKFVKTATSVVNKGDTVRVRVLSVDAGANRIALSMKGMSRSAGEDHAVLLQPCMWLFFFISLIGPS